MRKKTIENSFSFRVTNSNSLNNLLKINKELHHSTMSKTLNFLLDIGIDTYIKNNNLSIKNNDISAVENKKMQQLHNDIVSLTILNTRLYNIIIDQCKGAKFSDVIMENGGYDAIPDCIDKDNLYKL